MSLFQTGSFTLHSGDRSDFKIDCDYLKLSDLQSLAKFIGSRFQFSEVYGIPSGGTALANALRVYRTDTPSLLIVDDVYTTGASMKDAYLQHRGKWKSVQGVVIFSRAEEEWGWVTPLFKASRLLRP